MLTDLARSSYTELGQSDPSTTPPTPFAAGLDATGSATFLQSTSNGVNILLGVGVLSLPFSFSVSGWLVGAGLLLLMSITTNYTGKLIGRIMEYGQGTIRSFPDIGAAAFGSAGQWVISVVFFIELFSACGMYLILCGDNLEALVRPVANVTQTQLTLMAAGVMFPTALTSNLSFLSYFSAIGLASSCFLAMAVVTIGILNGPRNEGTFLAPAPTQLITVVERGPLAIGLVMVGFAGHACFPSIRCSMARPEQFGRVLDWSYAACFTVYMGVASLGYLMYGNATQKEITLNILGDAGAKRCGEEDSPCLYGADSCQPDHKVWADNEPVALMVEESLLGEGSDTGGPGHGDGRGGSGTVLSFCSMETTTKYPKTKTNCRHFLCSKCIRIGLTAACVAAAVSLPFFARGVGFIGAFCSCFVSIVFPLAAAMRLLDMGKCEFMICLVLLMLGCVFTVWGTVAVFLSPV